MLSDFPAAGLQCVDAEGNALVNNSVIVTSSDDNLVHVNCSYSNVTPRSHLILYEEGHNEPLQFVNNTDATEQNERFSLAIAINR